MSAEKLCPVDSTPLVDDRPHDAWVCPTCGQWYTTPFLDAVANLTPEQAVSLVGPATPRREGYGF